MKKIWMTDLLFRVLRRIGNISVVYTQGSKIFPYCYFSLSLNDTFPKSIDKKNSTTDITTKISQKMYISYCFIIFCIGAYVLPLEHLKENFNW